MAKQKYESYWKITLEYTDFYDGKFIQTLDECIKFIDENNKKYTPKLYSDLQHRINNVVGPKNLASIRKSINELVKLGFIEPKLNGYHSSAKEYINAPTIRRRKSLLSKIVYSNSGFQKSITKIDDKQQINFLIKTLEECGSLSKQQLKGIILSDIGAYPRGYLTREELEQLTIHAEQIQFDKRKYNQVDFLKNLLSKLDNITCVNNVIYFDEDAKKLFGEDRLSTKAKKRDPYLHRLYKNQLEEESQRIYGDIERCMLEKLPYPVLIASHIKPFIDCDDNEAYDPNNGLLLSKTIDSLFDLKYLSFSDEGKIIFYKRVHEDIVQFWKDYQLDQQFINDERKRYLAVHRKMCVDKNA